MPHRVRWLLLGNAKKVSIDHAVKKMKERQFSSGNPTGFKIHSVSRSVVSAEYIERFEFTEVVENPLGGENFSYTQTRFRRIPFSLSIGLPHLELVNPPSGINEFLNVIAGFFDFDVSISTPEVDIEAWSVAVISKMPDVYVDRMKVSKIQLSDSASASAVVTGLEDVRSYAEKFGRGKGRRIDAIRLASPDYKIELSRFGGLSSENQIEESVVRLVREALVKEGLNSSAG